MNAAVVKLAEAANSKGRSNSSREPLKTFGAHPTSGGEMTLMEGRYGPYVTDGATNATLPKTADPATFTAEEAVALSDARAAKGQAQGNSKACATKQERTKPPKSHY